MDGNQEGRAWLPKKKKTEEETASASGLRAHRKLRREDHVLEVVLVLLEVQEDGRGQRLVPTRSPAAVKAGRIEAKVSYTVGVL